MKAMPGPGRLPSAFGLLSSLGIFLAVLAPTVLLADLYLDDYGFVATLQNASAASIWSQCKSFVPGRNLHLLAMAALIRATGGSVVWMHAIGLLVSLANVAFVYLLVLRWTGFASIAFPAATAFALFFNHGETHYQIIHHMQVSLPFLLLLAAVHRAGCSHVRLPRRLTESMALYAVSLFIYDQVFFLWPAILISAWNAERERRPGPALSVAALFAFSLDLTHILYRYLSPTAGGGRPLIRWGDVPARVRESIQSSLLGVFDLPTRGMLPHWGWTVLIAAAALAAGVWLLQRHRTMRESEPGLSAYLASAGPARLAAFGAIWFFLAYLPNYFWYLSPRHNYIPSFGWALFWTGLIGWTAHRSSRFRAVLGVLLAVLFANAVVANVHEGSEWLHTGRLHRDYLREAVRLREPLKGVFLLGAPRYQRRAPAFHLQPHDVALSLAAAKGLSSLDGALQAAPTRGGLIYNNDLSLLGPEHFRHVPYSRVNAVGYTRDGGFRCLGKLSVTLPDGRVEKHTLRRSPGCDAAHHLTADTALIRTEDLGRAQAADSLWSDDSASLADARIVASGGRLAIELTWDVRSGQASEIAVVPSIHTPEGSLLYRTVHQSPTTRHWTPLLWPLLNDLPQEGRRRPGRRMREIYRLRTDGAPLASGPCLLVLKLYRLQDGASPRLLGEVRIRTVT